MKKRIPKYIQNLSAIGIKVEKLWNSNERRFLRRKELIERVGEEEFKVLETIGRTIREGRWKSAVKAEYLEEDLLEIFGDARKYPPEVRDLLKGRTEVNSLTYHYLKRKYVDGWDLKSPEELDEMFIKHIKNPEGLIYKQGDRIAIELDRFVAVIHPPDTKITLFKLKDKYRDYEDYANQMNMPILKLWQLKYILRRL